MYRNFTDDIRYYQIYPKGESFFGTDVVFRYIVVPTDMKDSIVSLVRASEDPELGIEGGDELRGDPDINSDGSVDLYDAAAMKNLLRGCRTLTEPLRDIESETAKMLTRMYFKANLNGDIWLSATDRRLWPNTETNYGFNVMINRRGLPYEPDGYKTDSDGGGSPDYSTVQHNFQVYEFTDCYPKEDSYDTTLWEFLGFTSDPEGTEPEFRPGEQLTIPNGFEPEFCHRQPNKVKLKNTFYLYRVFRNKCTHELTYTTERVLNSNNFDHTGVCACGQATDTGRCVYSSSNNQCPVCKTRFYDTYLIFDFNGGTDGRGGMRTNQLIIDKPSRNIRLDMEPVREGYTLLGWSTDPDATTPEYKQGGYFTVKAETPEQYFVGARIYAVWQKDCDHTIQYQVKRGSEWDEFVHYGTCECGEVSDEGSCTYSKSNNNNVCSVCKTRFNFIVLETELNGGTAQATGMSQIYPDADVIEFYVTNHYLPTRDGYTFLGWAEDKDATEPTWAPMGYIPVTVNDPTCFVVRKTIYAVWQKDPEPCDHTVNYQVKLGSAWDEFIHYGMCECGEVSDEGICDYTRDHNVCSVCGTRFNYFGVSFMANGGTLSSTGFGNIYLNTDTKICDLSNTTPPSRDGYTLLGWSEDENAAEPTWTPTDSITLTADDPTRYYVTKRLYAVWQKDQASCTHENVSYAPTGSDPNKLSQHAVTCVDCGQVVGDPADCVFKTVSEYVDRCSVCGNEKIKYSLTVDFNGGTGLLIDLPPDVSPDGTASVGSKSQSNILTTRSYVMMIDLSALKDSTIIKDGYTLLGFADSADATEAKYQVGDKFELTADVPARTVYAVWKSDECQHEHVQWLNVSGSGIEWSKLKHFFICSDCGYTSSYEDCDFKYAFETNPETCTVCGNKLYQYQVKFDYNLPSGESIDGALGVTLTLPATEGPFFTLDTSDPFFDMPTSSLMPERPGYTLLGWQEGPAADDETVDFPAGSEILLHVNDRQREFRAVWQKTCDHENTSYVPTGDDPHNLDKHVLTCQDCGQAVGEAEACVFEPYVECFKCSVCGNLRTEFVLTLNFRDGTGVLADGMAVVSEYDYTCTTTDRSHEFMIDMSVFQDGAIRKDGYVFAGWSDSWGTFEAKYSNGDTVVLAIDDLPVEIYYPGPYCDLYAVWKEDKPEVSVNLYTQSKVALVTLTSDPRSDSGIKNHGTDGCYLYNGKPMYWVEGYETYAYCVVIEDGQTLDDIASNAADLITFDENVETTVIERTYDVDGNGTVDFNDSMYVLYFFSDSENFVEAVRSQNELTIMGYLRADVTRDKTVDNTADYEAVHSQYA